MKYEQLFARQPREFVIKYFVYDKAGNNQRTKADHTDCPPRTEDGQDIRTPLRTVVVQDTLPPVITLHVDKVHDSSNDAETHVTQPLGPDSAPASNPSTRPENVYNKNPAYDVYSNGVGNPFMKSTIDSDRVQNIANSFVKAASSAAHGKHRGLYPNAPELMAEQQGTSVNAWVVGAVASAVSGLALLVAAARKRPEVTVEV